MQLFPPLSGFVEHGMANELFQQLQSSRDDLTLKIMPILLDLSADLGSLHIEKVIQELFKNLPRSSIRNFILETSILKM